MCKLLTKVARKFVPTNDTYNKQHYQQRGAAERGLRWSRALPTFDAESKSAKIPKSLNVGGGGGVGGRLGPNFQLLMLSPNLLKSKIL